MSSTFDNDSDIPLSCPFESLGNLFWAFGLDGICRVVPNRASLSPGIYVSSHTRPIRKNWITGIVHPYGIVDADGISSMPCRIEPLGSNSRACILIEIRLVRVTY